MQIGNQSLARVKLLVKQGNTAPFNLKFSTRLPNGEKEPLDLTQFTSIKMDVKKSVNINEEPFLTFDLTDGLTISGDDNNILEFTFEEEFTSSQNTRWFYDILFTGADGNTTIVGGEISIQLLVTGNG